MKTKSWLFPILLVALLSSLFTAVLTGAVPVAARIKHQEPLTPAYPVVSYQGQVTVNGQPFTGSGYFKFSIVDDGGSMYWSNDGTGAGGTEPSASILLPVNKGLFNVLLGDTNNGMLALTNNVFASNPGRFLRVWFSATGSAFTKLTPDRRFTWAPYAMTADNAFTLQGYAPWQLLVPADAMLFGFSESDPRSTDLLDNGYLPSGVSNVSAWSPTSTSSAPSARNTHTAVWTSSEMIIWGGNGGGTTGGRYDAFNDTWNALPTNNAPAARSYHTAVWTGDEMIIWGGIDDYSLEFINTGARYNRSTNAWTALPTSGAPTARAYHTAVWTGSEMIVWGGYGNSGVQNTGARYNPTSNTWTATIITGAPSGRNAHTAVWTGSEMIVWGGYDDSVYVNTGARYNPSANTWAAMTTTNAPLARGSHTAVWTGSEILIWGGYDGAASLDTGARYKPATNSWTGMSTSGAPSGRLNHTAVWADSEMLIWGGWNSSDNFGSGAAYSPSGDCWIALPIGRTPSARSYHTAVWTGSEMIIWGGNGYPGGSTYLNTGARLLYNLTLYIKP